MNHKSDGAGLEPRCQGNDLNALVTGDKHRIGSGATEGVRPGAYQGQSDEVGATGVHRHGKTRLGVVTLDFSDEIARELPLGKPLEAHAHSR